MAAVHASTTLNKLSAVAKRLGVSTRTVRSLVKSGRLPGCRLDGFLMVSDAALEAFVAGLPGPDAPALQPANLPQAKRAAERAAAEAAHP